MRVVRLGITGAYGGQLRRAIGVTASNRFSAFLTGLGVASLLQSSTATALMMSSFVSRGLLSVSAGFAIILGADVGTTLVAQVFSFDLAWLWPVLVVAGVVGHLTGGDTRREDLSRVAIGLGLILLSLSLITATSQTISGSAIPRDIFASLAQEPVLAALLAGVLAWLAHSSLAVVLLIVSLTTAGVVSPLLGFALVLGANVGGAFAAFIISAGAGPEAQRVPLGNFLFKTIGCLIALPLLDQIAPFIAFLEPESPRQIVNFHTLFNLGLAVTFLFATEPMARLCARMLPEKPKGDAKAKPRYLDPDVIHTPSVALAGAARETLRMGDAIESMLRMSFDALSTNDRRLVAEIQAADDIVDELHRSIKFYLTETSREPMGEADSRRCSDILSFAVNLEHVGDIIDKNLAELAAKKVKEGLLFSDEGMQEIAEMHDRLLDNLNLAMSVFISGDTDVARRLLSEKEHFRNLERAAADAHMERLRAGKPETIETTALHVDILRDLKRINSHIASVAYPILESEGDLLPSRLKAKDGLRSV